MKIKNILWIALFTIFLIACSKTSENEITDIAEKTALTETTVNRPQGIDMPYFGDVDFRLPNVPEYVGKPASAETRGHTIKVQPGSNQLQDIINNASAGSIIKLRPGSHIEDLTLVINHEVHLRGYDGATLVLNGEMGLAIIGADDTSIKDLTITTTNHSVLGIGVEDSEDFEFKRNEMTDFLIAIVLEQAYKASITENTIVGIDQVDGLGIVAMNGEKVSIRKNTVSGSAFGVWACDKNGWVYNNELYNNRMGLLLCKVPPGSFSPFFTIGNGGADYPCTEWKAKNNDSHDNVWGYVVVDGAKENKLSANEGHNNSFVDLELAGSTTALFGELTPGSLDNEVDAGDLYYIDCGEDNEVKDGHQIEVDCEATHSSTDILEKPEFITVLGSSSTLHRTENGISATFSTKNLIPNNAYTLWWVVFGESPGPPVLTTHAAGQVVGENGEGHFSSHLDVGNIFNNPLTAEVHLALRTHGPVQPSMMPEQIETLNGGCTSGFPTGPALQLDSDVVGYCANVQVAIHPAN